MTRASHQVPLDADFPTLRGIRRGSFRLLPLLKSCNFHLTHKYRDWEKWGERLEETEYIIALLDFCGVFWLGGSYFPGLRLIIAERQLRQKACLQRDLSEVWGQQRGCCNSRKHPQRTRSSLPGRFGQLWSGCCSWSLPGARPNGHPLRTSCWGPVLRPRWHHRLGVPPGSLPSPRGVVLVVWSVSPQIPGTSRKGRTGQKDWSGVGFWVWLWHFDLNGWFVFKSSDWASVHSASLTIHAHLRSEATRLEQGLTGSNGLSVHSCKLRTASREV